MSRKYIGILIAVAVAAVTFHLVRSLGSDGPRPHTDKHEAEVGRTAAELIQATGEGGGTVTILYLYPEKSEPYASRAHALRRHLTESGLIVNEVWSREEGHYNDDDFTASIDLALDGYPESDCLAIVAVGSVTHAGVSPKLKEFLTAGGKLFLVGSTHHESPFVELAKRGYATILARRTTWLKEADEHPRLQAAPEFVRSQFTLIQSSPN